jgi:hypothetical protein
MAGCGESGKKGDDEGWRRGQGHGQVHASIPMKGQQASQKMSHRPRWKRLLGQKETSRLSKAHQKSFLGWKLKGFRWQVSLTETPRIVPWRIPGS